MPLSAARPCRTPGCPHTTRAGAYCAHCEPKQRKVEQDRRGTAAQRGYGERWRKLRLMVLRAHPLCVVCGAPATDVDHIVRRSEGGTDEESNLQALCHACHSRKTLAETQRTTHRYAQ